MRALPILLLCALSALAGDEYADIKLDGITTYGCTLQRTVVYEHAGSPVHHDEWQAVAFVEHGVVRDWTRTISSRRKEKKAHDDCTSWCLGMTKRIENQEKRGRR